MLDYLTLPFRALYLFWILRSDLFDIINVHGSLSPEPAKDDLERLLFNTADRLEKPWIADFAYWYQRGRAKKRGTSL